MKYTLRLVMLIMTLFLISCINDKKINPYLFEVNNINSNVNNLKKQKFDRVLGIDLLLFKKQVSDTLIQLDIDENLKKIRKKIWKIRLKTMNEDYVQNFIQKYNVFKVGPTAYYEDGKSYFFTVVRSYDNNLYICKVVNEGHNYFLYVTYHNPLKINTYRK